MMDGTHGLENIFLTASLANVFALISARELSWSCSEARFIHKLYKCLESVVGTIVVQDL